MTTIVRIQGEGAKRLQAALNGLQGKVGKVGWFKESRYPEGPPVAYIASIQEFGSPAQGIPPRPFMRPTIMAKQDQWAKIANSQSRKIIAGKSTIGEAMEIIGAVAAGEIKETISAIHSPPLKPATIQNRIRQMANKTVIGNLTKPLVFTGILRGTLYNTVESL